MNVDYDERYPPAPADKLTELEHKIGRELPAEYRAYLQRQDGGTLAGYNNEGVEIIYGIGDVPDYASIWAALSTWQAEPIQNAEGLLPVAGDAGGNHFAIALFGDDRGSVWFVHHECEEDDDGNTYSIEVVRKSDSWPTFLESLQPVGDE